MNDAHHQLVRDVGAEAVKITPAVAMWTLTVNDVLAFVSIIYVLVQIGFLARKWFLIEQGRRAE